MALAPRRNDDVEVIYESGTPEGTARALGKFKSQDEHYLKLFATVGTDMGRDIFIPSHRIVKVVVM